jgi:hypothetical protein
MNVGVGGGETTDQRLRVFISSSPGELAEERDAASAAVRTLRLTSLLRGPGAGSHPLDESDVFVGIYWQSYGWTASPSTLSGIEDEYRLSKNG